MSAKNDVNPSPSDSATTQKNLQVYEFEDDDPSKTISTETRRPCDQLRYDLKMCMLETDCCKKDRRLPSECLRNRDPSVPDECYELKDMFYQCKRSLLDMRTRMRGRKFD